MERDARHILSELLVLRAQGGDEQAFAELFSLWRQDVVRLAATRLGSPEAAEEVAQNAWIAIARGLGGLDDPACFLRWAFRIVERRAADYIRRRQKERREATALEDYAADQQAIETTGAAANAGESGALSVANAKALEKAKASAASVSTPRRRRCCPSVEDGKRMTCGREGGLLSVQ